MRRPTALLLLVAGVAHAEELEAAKKAGAAYERL